MGARRPSFKKTFYRSPVSWLWLAGIGYGMARRGGGKRLWVSVGRKEDLYLQFIYLFGMFIQALRGWVAEEREKLEFWLIFSAKLIKGLHVSLYMHADVDSVAIDLARPKTRTSHSQKSRFGVRIASLERARLSLQNPPSVPLLNPLISCSRSGRRERESSLLPPPPCTLLFAPPFFSPPPCTPFLLSLPSFLVPLPSLYLSSSMHPISSLSILLNHLSSPSPPPCTPSSSYSPSLSPPAASPLPPVEGGGEVKVPASGR